MKRRILAAQLLITGGLLAQGCDDPTGLPGPSLPEGTSVQGDVAERIHDYLSEAEREQGLSAAVLLARGGNIELIEGYGTADRAAGTPVAPETVFDIGSLTKQFTAAGIMKLQERGRLSVTDPISEFFSGVPVEKRDITLHQLLTHSSGLPDFLPGAYSDFQVITRDSIIRGAMAAPLLFAPGERFEYSNLGYNLLAAVIELASGKAYERYLHDELLMPAGMRQTGYVIPRWDPGKLARGYWPGEGNNGDVGTLLDRERAPDGPWWILRGAGGTLSTIRDLYRWMWALQHRTVLSKRSVDQMFSPLVAMSEEGNAYYGYGWGVTEADEGLLISHDGTGLTHAEIRYYPERDLISIVATNRYDAFRFHWVNGIRILNDQPLLRDLPVSPAERATYLGEYEVGPYRVRIEESGGMLAVQVPGAFSSRLMYQGGHHFLAEADPTIGFEFTVRDGRALDLTLVQGGIRVTGPRVG